MEPDMTPFATHVDIYVYRTGFSQPAPVVKDQSGVSCVYMRQVGIFMGSSRTNHSKNMHLIVLILTAILIVQSTR
jgi:hypothetical protein